MVGAVPMRSELQRSILSGGEPVIAFAKITKKF
jgi:hypothetical protein